MIMRITYPPPLRTLTFDLQRRLPSDRVRGTITLTVENDSLPPNPTPGSGRDGQRHMVAVVAEPSTNDPRLSSPVHRLSRLTSICSEDSIDNEVQEVGGAIPGSGTPEAVPSSGGNLDTSVDVQTGEAVAAESAETREIADEVAMVTTFSGQKQLEAVEQKSDKVGQIDRNPVGDSPNTAVASEKRKSLEELDMIRMTLYGGTRRLPTSGKRRAHTVLSRHVSLRTAPPNKPRDSVRGEKLSGSMSMYQISTADFAESLPPSKHVTCNLLYRYINACLS